MWRKHFCHMCLLRTALAEPRGSVCGGGMRQELLAPEDCDKRAQYTLTEIGQFE